MPTITGKSKVGQGTILAADVIVGHPSKQNLVRHKDFEQSEGAVIGANCIMRSGCVVYENAQLGDNIQAAHNVIVREGAVLGDGCVLGNGTVVRESARLGSNVRAMESVVICEGARVGNNVFIGPNVSFTAGRYMTAALEAGGRMSREEAVRTEGKYWQGDSVVVEDEVRIGANAVIVAGVRLGAGCIVATGAIVSTSVPPGATVAGNPARVLKLAKQEG